MTALDLTNRMEKQGLNPKNTLRRITLMFQLTHLLLDTANDIEADLKKVGGYRMTDKQTLKTIRNKAYEFVKGIYPNLTEEQLNAMIEDLDELEKITLKWAGI